MNIYDHQTVDLSSGRPRGERRNRDKEVITAAISVMAAQGYAATSIQEIADRVGVLKGSLYHYFASKEEVLYRILSESHAHADEERTDVSGLGLTPLDELCEFLRRQSLWFLQNRDRAHIFFREARHLTGERRDDIRSKGQAYWQYLYDLLVAGQEAGQVTKDLSPLLLSEYVLGALNSVRDWPARTRRELNDRDVSDSFVRLTRCAIESR